MQRVGSEYILDTPIGRGSTGRVWRGITVPVGKPVAIKVLDPELVRDPGTVARFVQERSILTGLRSSHLVRVHDLVLERGTLAIVMDLVDGVDLRQHLRRVGAFAPGLAAELVGQVLGALSVVHRAGIVHCDVKPENILLDLADAARPRAMLTDFGIARILRGPAEARPGGLSGTLRYLAPEVARSGETSPASDLYSTGVVLYELLAGRPPFESNDPIALLREHELDQPRPIAGLPDALQAVLGQLLSKSPAQRPPSATAARQLLAAAAVEVRGRTALPSLGDTERYDGPTIPPGMADTVADLPLAHIGGGDLARAAGAGSSLAASPVHNGSEFGGSAHSGSPTGGLVLGTLLRPDAPHQGGGLAGAGFVAGGGFGAPGPEHDPRPWWASFGALVVGILAVVVVLLMVVGYVVFSGPGSSPTDDPAVTVQPSPTAAPTESGGVVPIPTPARTSSTPTPAKTSDRPSPTASATPTTPPPTVTTAPPAPVLLPNVVGLTRVHAVDLLKSDGVTAVTTTRGCYRNTEADHIAGQTPTAGGQITASTQVTLTVQDAACLTVPNVVSMPVQQALTVLAAAGFTTVNQVGPGRNGGAGRTVLKQSLAAGSSVLPQPITIRVSAAA